MLKPIAAQRNARIVRTRIAEMFKVARYAVARNVKWQIGSTYWKVGRENAMFEELVEQPAINLRQQCGCGFVRRSLWQVRAFDRTWPDQQIRQTLSDESLTDNAIWLQKQFAASDRRDLILHLPNELSCRALKVLKAPRHESAV